MSEFVKNLNDNIFRIQACINVDSQILSDLLGVTSKQLEEFRSGFQNLRIENLEWLCETLGISLENLFTGNIDYPALAQQFGGNVYALPDRYSNSQQHFARARTIMGIIEYLNSLFGPKYVHNILSRLQVRREYFDNPDAFISPYLVTDLLTELRKSGFHENHNVEMGKSAAKVNEKTRVGKVLSSSDGPSKMYERLHAEIMDAHYDHLFYYSLSSLSENDLRMTTTPRRHSHDLLETRTFGHRETCLYKQGVYTSFLSHIGCKNYKLEEEKCMYHGDEHCVYHLSWSLN
ncbi:MAG: hypothetical protein AB1540_16640 [Bdellovibrionota bacterium]